MSGIKIRIGTKQDLPRVLELVKELVNQTFEPGKYKSVWEGKNTAGKTVASGVYLYRLEAGGKCITHKMLMLK